MTRSLIPILIAFSVAVVEPSVLIAQELGSRPAQASARSHPARLDASYGRLPLIFEANEGQADSSVRFLARGRGFSLFLTPGEAVSSLANGGAPAAGPGQEQSAAACSVRLAFDGAQPAPAIRGLNPRPTKVNYLTDRDPSKWRRNVTTWGKVHYSDIYPGIDAVFYGRDGEFEYDLIVRPGVRPDVVRLWISGADRIRIDPAGDLVLDTPCGTVRHNAPVAYQEMSGRRHMVSARYRLAADGRVEIAVGAYDSTHPLVIDPVLVYSTYLGGSGVTNAYGVKADAQGNVYVTGSTTAGDFPIRGGLNLTVGGFIMKLNPTGTDIVYSTFIPGTGVGLDVDATGSVYVCGTTFSTNFPLVNPFQPSPPELPAGFDHQANAFAMRLTPAGDNLVFSTYLGGSLQDQGTAIAADAAGNAYITGDTVSSDFPVLNAYKPTIPSANYNTFVVKLGPSGAGLYSTYLGGAGSARGTGIIADVSGQAIVFGHTGAEDFPVVSPAAPCAGPKGTDLFVTKFTASGNGLVFSRCIGGTDSDFASQIGTDGNGNIYISGVTLSTNFPVANAFQPAHAGGSYDAFVTKLSPDASTILYSTYLGSPGSDFLTGSLAVDASGQAYVAGRTDSAAFPIVNALQPKPAGAQYSAVVFALNPQGTALTFSSYIGGSGGSGSGGTQGVNFGAWSGGIAVDPSGNIYVSGTTDGGTFPITPDAIRTDYPGARSGFVLKITQASAPCTYSINSASAAVPSSGAPGSFSIVANGSTCAWTAVSDAPWITLTGATSGSGIGVIGYVAQFNGGMTRAGTVTVAGQTFAIAQSGTAQSSCTFTIAPSSATVPLSGGTGTVAVTASASNCVWTGTSRNGWISVTSGLNGTGSGSVTYSASSRISPSTRSGTLSIAGRTFTVTQLDVAAPGITPNPSSQTVAVGQNVTFTTALSGSPAPTAQWQVSAVGGTTFTNLSNAAPYSGVTTPIMTITGSTIALNGYRYRIVATNSAGTATSAAATLTVNAAPIFTTQPANRTISAGDSGTFTVAVSGNPTPTIQWQVSTTGGASYTDLTNTGPYSGVTTPTLTVTSSPPMLNGYQYRATATNSLGSTTSMSANLTVTSPPSVAIDRTSLQFAATNTGKGLAQQTASQTVRISQSGTGTVTWTATSNQPWLAVTPASGSGSGTLTVGVAFHSSLPVDGTSGGSVTLAFTGATSTAGPITVNLTTKPNGTATRPFGLIDTPVNNATGVTGSIAVTGWALDDLEVTRVRIFRDPVVAGEGTSPIFLGDAVFVDGSRSEVAAANPSVPRNTRAGWGYLLLTNFLPNEGNGTFRLHAFADDADGHTTLLGSKTITCANNTATRPFGAIDTPAQGETVNGTSYNNFGWVLARGPALAYPPFGTVQVVIDGVFGASPGGWTSRADLTTLFPAATYPGVTNALGVSSFDPTTLADGVHTIAWVVTADNGLADGIGSRYFTVANGSSVTADLRSSFVASGFSEKTAVSGKSFRLKAEATDATHLTPLDRSSIAGRRGWDPTRAFQTYAADASGRVTILSEELDRIELQAGEGATGYLRMGTELGPLPIGSRLDPDTGVFTWQPGVGFVHDYDFVFVRWNGPQAVARREVRIVLNPKGSNRVGPQVVIDVPGSEGPGPEGRFVAQPFVVAGWAIDADAAVGTGVDTLHVWAYPLTGDDPIFLGATAYGGARPDVGEVFGERFERSGYGLTVNALPSGTYDLAVFARSTVKDKFQPAKVVRVTVR